MQQNILQNPPIFCLIYSIINVSRSKSQLREINFSLHTTKAPYLLRYGALFILAYADITSKSLKQHRHQLCDHLHE